MTDVTAAFKGFTQPLNEVIDDIHRRGWTVNKIHIKDGQYAAEGKNPHGEKLEAVGRTDATAAANLLVKIMRREHMRSSAVKEKLGAWDHSFESQLAEIAQAYMEAPIYEPKAAPAWMDLAQDLTRRAQTIRQQIHVEYTDDPTPYATADEMREDVTTKKHIEVTRAFAHHPIWNEQQMLDYRLVADVLGHTIGGADWGWHGTCLAFATLAPMVAELPQKALFTELVGQTAFGSVYRQWGPQKIAFLDDLIEKAQEKQNGPGHTGVHPSQSLIPGQIPRIGKVAAGNRLWWQPGDWGRGLYNGTTDELAHWPEDEYEHDQARRAFDKHVYSGWDGATAISIDPEGYWTYAEDADDEQYAALHDAMSRLDPRLKNVADRDGRQKRGAILQRTQDPNANWQSGVQPLPDNAYMWQRQGGIDPLDSQTVTDSLRPLEPGLSKMHPEMAKQAVVNALRAALLGSRRTARDHAVHYQTLHPIPAHVDDPMAYWDTLEQAREGWNQASGYAPHSHEQYWPEKQMFMQWVKALNPSLDDGAVQRLAKRELMHMLTEEEQRLVSQDPNEELTTEQLEHEAYEALRKRLRSLTKPNVDQKVDFGNERLFHEAAVHPEWLQQWIAEHGPYLYHGSHVATPELIAARGGLVPGTGHQQPVPGDDDSYHAAIRPGHVYLAAKPWYRSKYGYPYQYRIDVRQLDPSNLTADEDVTNEPEAYKSYGGFEGNPSWTVMRLAEEEAPGSDPRWPTQSRGQWFNEQPFADDPQLAALSLRGFGTIAHRGVIPASAIAEHQAPESPYSMSATVKLATHHADMYPPYMHSHLRPLAQISRNATAFADAAREDLLNHKGHGHHFRATALSLGIPEIGPRQASHAWLHLAPQTSQLGVINPQTMEILGHNTDEDSPRDYFRHERELQAGRDAAGYGHVPLGAFSAGLHDLYSGGPGWHPDRTVLKAVSPTPHQTINWTMTTPTYPGWSQPYWWDSTQEARDGVAQDFDRNIAVEHSKSEVPFQRESARPGSDPPPVRGTGLIGRVGSLPGATPWVTDPVTGQRLTGAPGTSLMQHLKDSFGHPDVHSVWAQDYELGKGSLADAVPPS